MRKDEKGQSLVEMALLLPILLFILVGIFDIGRVLYTHIHLHLATQETVRLGALGASDHEMRTFAREFAIVGDATSLEILIHPNESQRRPGQYVTVTLQYPIEFFTPFVSKLVPTSFKMSANSTIRIE